MLPVFRPSLSSVLNLWCILPPGSSVLYRRRFSSSASRQLQGRTKLPELYIAHSGFFSTLILRTRFCENFVSRFFFASVWASSFMWLATSRASFSICHALRGLPSATSRCWLQLCHFSTGVERVERILNWFLTLFQRIDDRFPGELAQQENECNKNNQLPNDKSFARY